MEVLSQNIHPNLSSRCLLLKKVNDPRTLSGGTFKEGIRSYLGNDISETLLVKSPDLRLREGQPFADALSSNIYV